MRADTYQKLLIASGLLVTALFGVFFYRELYPEYKIYQDDYVALEKFRSTYTHLPPAPFQIGIKQIVLEAEDLGPPTIDRCTTCHVALQIPYYSPTKIAHDINGNILRDEKGYPILEKNEEYIWDKLDQKIAALKDEKVNEQLTQEGNHAEVKIRLREAEKYEALKVAHVDEQEYDVRKVLKMHPLIGKETRPFEFHPVEEYGCTSCHNGNGRGLVTDKAHGPVFDGQYETEFRGFIPQFTEPDPENDPPFARIFNSKPGHSLLFQTTPLFVGPLIQAKCLQCHLTSDVQLDFAINSASDIANKREGQYKQLKESLEKDKQTLLALLELRKEVNEKGLQNALEELKQKQSATTLSGEELEQVISQYNYLSKISKTEEIDQKLVKLIGSKELVNRLQEVYDQQGSVDEFLNKEQSSPAASGLIFGKMARIKYDQDILRHVQDTQESFQTTIQDQKDISALHTDIDDLTKDYQRGKQLYLSQACYACHKIAGLARGGVGPELTRIGDQYPWYVKESIVWPQADLVNSTMPNMRLDHEELEDLMAFLLAQKGSNQAVAQANYKAAIQSWEGGRKLPWEKPITPAQMFDLRYAMTVFVTEGCASCHRLMGFDSNVGFKVEKEKPTFDALFDQQQWFRKVFPETVRVSQYDEELPGSSIVTQIEKYAKEIDDRIVSDVRQDSIIEEIENKFPGAVEALYSNFRYASRAKDHYYQTLAEKDPEKRAEIESEHAAWKDRVHRVLMTYVQVYGLGRLIGPRPNWSGVFRSDEWLMEHFRNPSVHVPRSIMPAFPFDDTKFYALTMMLDRLAVRNRDSIREIWDHRGFDPALAFQLHCVQCHGISLAGNGAVAEWIYPIPKNLRDPVFLRNLTRERAHFSIIHGVKGTPMPPWGEVAKDKPEDINKISHHIPVLTEAEATRIVDWLFSTLPGGEIIKETKDVPKWEYTPQDVLEELKKEGGTLPSQPQEKVPKIPEKELPQENVSPSADESSVSNASIFPSAEGLYASIGPEIYPRIAAPKQEFEVEDVFDIVPNPKDYPDPYGFYIKKKYYTPYNLEEGQKFFLLNCAVCHGNEGDGAGARSKAMQEAKPRMLTNLDWIHSRDDLRLLRSIKYGVPGTAMTPWGDLTNSLQRIQLVMFIRSLTTEQDRRESLSQALYQTFDEDFFVLDRARIKHSELIMQAKQKEQELRRKQLDLEHVAEEENGKLDQVINVYQQSLELSQQLVHLQEQEKRLQDLKKELQHQRELYQSLGLGLITKNVDDFIWEDFMNLIKLSDDRYTFENGKLIVQKVPEEKTRHLQQRLLQRIDQEIDKKELEKKTLEQQSSLEAKNELEMLNADLISYRKLRIKLLTDIEEAIRSLKKQETLVQNIQQE